MSLYMYFCALCRVLCFLLFFFNDTATTEIYTLSLHDALPIFLFHLDDSGGRPFVLSWTHEESMTFLAREIQSYKQLPQVWYHFSTKDRDEPRPRGGLLRLREFIMKDAYTFDADEAALDVAFRAHVEAYAR